MTTDADEAAPRAKQRRVPPSSIAEVRAAAADLVAGLDRLSTTGPSEFAILRRSPPRTRRAGAGAGTAMTRPDYTGADVARIRARTGLNKAQFAELMRINRTAVVQWEHGAHLPSGPALRLLELLDIDAPESPVLRVLRQISQPR